MEPPPLSTMDLRSFGISTNAFLPDEPLITALPDYYEPWEAVAQNFIALVGDGSFRAAAKQLPILSTNHLESPMQWRRAYVILAYFTQAYVWGGSEAAEMLPPQISVPFLRVSAELELPPVLTASAANLWNFEGDASEPEALRTLISFTGTKSESWFLLIGVAIEARGARIIEAVVKGLHATESGNYRVLIDVLAVLRTCIQDVTALLSRLYEKCDPLVFYHQVRPYYAGSKNMEAAGLPRGLFYDEGDGKGQWRQLQGGSMGQSPLIHLLDAVMGIDHDEDVDLDDEEKFHSEVKKYMQGPHRRFLEYVSNTGSFRNLALAPPCSEDHHRLKESYTAAAEALAALRGKHFQIVTRYIILPSKRPWKQRQETLGLARLSPSASDDNALTGTAGTMLASFLKRTRDQTAAAGNLQDGDVDNHYQSA
ncbi:hypothetical protein XA68_15688 [Ophiocordyceps unilateralis]|uniref:Indoleamine 2,3-dioxygenase n=1 Tax=Ophiocordyceps unilateralis TaxID=268505 RepID=A0A2A9P6L2_OPHUN|nr:hypothetical protein XA68_15688 [Ophiocordyceps unilateralis]